DIANDVFIQDQVAKDQHRPVRQFWQDHVKGVNSSISAPRGCWRHKCLPAVWQFLGPLGECAKDRLVLGRTSDSMDSADQVVSRNLRNKGKIYDPASVGFNNLSLRNGLAVGRGVVHALAMDVRPQP